jgi:hypothetical protein
MVEPGIAGPLLGAIAQAPWVRLRTVGDVATDPTLRPTDEPSRLVATERDAGTRYDQGRAARRLIDTFSSTLAAPSGATEIDALERLLLASESADYDRRISSAVALARVARERAQNLLAGIRVTPERRRVTLTRRGGQVPVTIRNRTGHSIRLRVSLVSPRVTFPEGSVRRIEIEGRARGTTLGTVTFRIEARSAGTFPIDVRLETPDGQNLVATGQVQVRSSAVSAVTLMATAGGALFLVGAWARRVLSRRRKRAASA